MCVWFFFGILGVIDIDRTFSFGFSGIVQGFSWGLIGFDDRGGAFGLRSA